MSNRRNADNARYNLVVILLAIIALAVITVMILNGAELSTGGYNPKFNN